MEREPVEQVIEKIEALLKNKKNPVSIHIIMGAIKRSEPTTKWLLKLMIINQKVRRINEVGELPQYELTTKDD